MARIHDAQGNVHGALEMLSEAESVRRRDPLPVTRPIQAIRTRMRIAQDDVASATLWVKQSGIDSGDEVNFIREYEFLTFARVLIAQKQHDNALQLLERLRVSAMTGRRIGSVVETWILQALVEERLGNTANALDAISSALEMAQAEGFVRLFVDEGLPMRDLLRRATARGVAGEYTRRILGFFEEAREPVVHSMGLLTSRELEILRLIAAGMRNQDIAKQLFISPATVKRHIANVYSKLDAGHRTEALKRAAALNLL
jgi:LuxR family maltose regulon positive regulatory protein